MAWIVVTRNPRTNRLTVIEDDNNHVVEFETDEKADAFADTSKLCQAWGYEAIFVST